MSEHEILKLNHPVILADGKKLDHLEVRRPTVGDILDLSPDGGDVILRSARLAARLCVFSAGGINLVETVPDLVETFFRDSCAMVFN